MYQSEALWLNIDDSYISRRRTGYPFAIKIATGKINAVSGNPWDSDLSRIPQNYLVSTEQPWLDGYCVEKGIIRQFVAMPLGKGYTAEEQLTRVAKYGGIQIQVFPMKKEVFEKRFPPRKEEQGMFNVETEYCMVSEDPGMGLAPGGRMRQEIYDDPFEMSDWDLTHTSRCFVHIANSQVWKEITGEKPPTLPPTAKEYSDIGLPWFAYYSDTAAVNGSETLGKLSSVKTLGEVKKEEPLPENEGVANTQVIKLGVQGNKVREGDF